MCSNYTGAQEWNHSFMLKWGNGTCRWMDRLHEREPVISAALKKKKGKSLLGNTVSFGDHGSVILL